MQLKVRKTLFAAVAAVALAAVCIGAAFYQTSPARCTKVVDIRSIEYEDIYAQYDEFELGENQYGMLVFKKPGQAEKKAMELCADVLEKIRKKYHLEFKPDNPERIAAYLSYGDQMSGTSAKEYRQIGFLGTSISICEHSKRSFYEKKGIFHLAPPAV